MSVTDISLAPQEWIAGREKLRRVGVTAGALGAGLGLASIVLNVALNPGRAAVREHLWILPVGIVVVAIPLLVWTWIFARPIHDAEGDWYPAVLPRAALPNPASRVTDLLGQTSYRLAVGDDSLTFRRKNQRFVVPRSRVSHLTFTRAWGWRSQGYYVVYLVSGETIVTGLGQTNTVTRLLEARGWTVVL